MRYGEMIYMEHVLLHGRVYLIAVRSTTQQAKSMSLLYHDLRDSLLGLLLTSCK